MIFDVVFRPMHLFKKRMPSEKVRGVKDHRIGKTATKSHLKQRLAPWGLKNLFAI